MESIFVLILHFNYLKYGGKKHTGYFFISKIPGSVYFLGNWTDLAKQYKMYFNVLSYKTTKILNLVEIEQWIASLLVQLLEHDVHTSVYDVLKMEEVLLEKRFAENTGKKNSDYKQFSLNIGLLTR